MGGWHWPSSAPSITSMGSLLGLLLSAILRAEVRLLVALLVLVLETWELPAALLFLWAWNTGHNVSSGQSFIHLCSCPEWRIKVQSIGTQRWANQGSHFWSANYPKSHSSDLQSVLLILCGSRYNWRLTELLMSWEPLGMSRRLSGDAPGRAAWAHCSSWILVIQTLQI